MLVPPSIFDSPNRDREIADAQAEIDARYEHRKRIYREQAERKTQFKNNLRASHARSKQ